MSRTQHVDPARSLAIAALHEDDSEHADAYAHGRSCDGCRALLAQGGEMFVLLEGARELPRVDAALKARVLESVERPRPRALGIARLVLCLSLMTSCLLAWIDGGVGGILRPALGVECALIESAVALLPLGAFMMLVRRGMVRFDVVSFAALASVGALVAQAYLHFRCEAHDLIWHLFAFHVLGVVGAALLGGTIGRLVLNSRSAP